MEAVESDGLFGLVTEPVEAGVRLPVTLAPMIRVFVTKDGAETNLAHPSSEPRVVRLGQAQQGTRRGDGPGRSEPDGPFTLSGVGAGG